MTTLDPETVAILAAPERQTIDAFLVWLADHAREGLERVRSAVRWTRVESCASNGARCLGGHAWDCRLLRTDDGWLVSLGTDCEEARSEWDSWRAATGIKIAEFAFDDLTREFGLAPVVALIQSRAGELLEQGSR